MATLEDFETWFRELSRFGSTCDHVEVVHWYPVWNGDGERSMTVRLYTDNNRFTIRAVQRLPGKEGYLACGACCRKPRAGEDWTRGNDLADGALSKETWHRILADIVSYELVRVHKPKPATALGHENAESGPDLPAAATSERAGDYEAQSAT